MNDSGTIAPQARDYFGFWNDLIVGGLSRHVGADIRAEISPDGSSPAPAGEAPEPGIWIRLFGGKAGEQAFFLAAPGAARLARLLSGGDADELSENGKQTVVQFFQQLATMIPSADWFGLKCELDASAVERIDWPAAADTNVKFLSPQGPVFDLRIILSADFVSALQPPECRTTVAAKPSPPAGASKAAGQSASAAAHREVNLDLLMDVELEATLRFGQREMLLGDVLNLAPGSVVELDQQVHDPVELLVGSKVIAWGEVVAVDGNYGLRITGLASREERLESLRR